MTDTKQPWPKPDPIVMTTNDIKLMESVIKSEAQGIALANKLRRVYKIAFTEGKKSNELTIGCPGNESSSV